MNKQLDPAVAARAVHTPRLQLDAFFPYRLALLHGAINRSLARIYSDRYDVTLHEWRAIAVLGDDPQLSANEVGRRTALDKVQVSRAVNRLLGNGLVHRGTDPCDRRRSSLKLTAKGEQIYHEIVSIALEHESTILEVLTETERRDFLWMTEKLLTHSTELQDKSR